jgi:hypothetical protein
MLGGAVEVTFELFRPFVSEGGVYMCIAENEVDVVIRSLMVAVRGELVTYGGVVGACDRPA